MASNFLRGIRQSKQSQAPDPSVDMGNISKPPAPPPPTVTFARRTHSGRYRGSSRDDLDSDLSSTDFSNYHVHIPLTPDHQPMDEMDPYITARAEEQYVSSSLFTGGFNNVTRAHYMDKVTESDSVHPQMAGTNGSSCSIVGCNQKIMCDERGDDILPCECDFKICVDCFTDAVKTGGVCPGCKEQYRNTDLEDVLRKTGDGKALSLPAPEASGAKMDRRLSMMKSTNLDFDHNRWLFETKGTYGYGNALWPAENGGGGGDGGDEQRKELLAKPWRPLSRKLKIPAAILSPYR